MDENTLRYKGFSTSVYFEPRTNTFYGKLEGIGDLVTWEHVPRYDVGDAFGIRKAFVEAVDDYLSFLEKPKKEGEE